MYFYFYHSLFERHLKGVAIAHPFFCVDKISFKIKSIFKTNFNCDISRSKNQFLLLIGVYVYLVVFVDT